MRTFATYALEALVSSGVLLAAYTLLLERRVPFRWCRVYLIATTCIAALIPLLRIPVWPAKVLTLAPMEALPVTGDWLPEAAPEPFLTPGVLMAACYLLGVALLAGLLLAQILRIRRLHRGATVTHAARYRIIRTPQKIAPFSLFRTIYVWDGTPEAQFRAIAAHEASHIAHHHTAERILMECLKALLWWNPFVWMAARRLTEAEEFEADSDVLHGGYDLQEYMQTIFTQLMGYSPDIASNLRDSLTKKRFQMMTTKLPGRYGLLRLAGTLPALLALLCAFSFTTRAAEIRIAETEKVPADPITTASDEGKKEVFLVVLHNNKPLAGAAVVISGTNIGSVTDADGQATLRVKPGSKLIVSYVGCKTKLVEISGDPVAEMIPISLETEVNNLSPVSITSGDNRNATTDQKAAAGKVSLKITLGSSSDQESGSANEPAVGATVVIAGTKKGVVADTKGEASIEAPEGAVLEVGYPDYPSASVVIGQQRNYAVRLVPENYTPEKYPGSGDNATPEPLYIVDGLEQPGINDLDTRNIESITVLKDQTATALYGSKGRNGVIIVTTKHPSKTAQDEATFDPETGSLKIAASDKDEPFLVVEQMPRFRDGDLSTFRAWLQQQIHYPAEAVKNGIEGRVILSFILERDGSVSNVKVLQAPDKSLADEAVRVLESSPAWTPGSQRGQTVRVKYVVPVDFRLGTLREAAPAQPEQTAGDEPFLIVEQMPTFQGGNLNDFRQWVMARIRYPDEALKAGLTGRVIAQFIVERDGTLRQPRIIDSPGDQLSDEVVRVLKTSPRWQPGMQRGTAVRVVFTLPVDFRIPGKNAPEARTQQPGEIDQIIVVGYGSNK